MSSEGGSSIAPPPPPPPPGLLQQPQRPVLPVPSRRRPVGLPAGLPSKLAPIPAEVLDQAALQQRHTFGKHAPAGLSRDISEEDVDLLDKLDKIIHPRRSKSLLPKTVPYPKAVAKQMTKATVILPEALWADDLPSRSVADEVKKLRTDFEQLRQENSSLLDTATKQQQQLKEQDATMKSLRTREDSLRRRFKETQRRQTCDRVEADEALLEVERLRGQNSELCRQLEMHRRGLEQNGHSVPRAGSRERKAERPLDFEHSHRELSCGPEEHVGLQVPVTSGAPVHQPRPPRTPRSPRPGAAEKEQSLSAEEGLRRALLDNTSPAATLREAIRGVEALLNEARRELGRKEMREQRAAMEQLYTAMGKDEVPVLETALKEARAAGVDDADLTRGEDRLRQLQSQTDEEKQAIAMQRRQRRLKEEAFMHVKGDNVVALQELLSSSDMADVAWESWRNQAGWSLQTAARQLGAKEVEAYFDSKVAAQSGLDWSAEVGIGGAASTAAVSSSAAREVLQATDLSAYCGDLALEADDARSTSADDSSTGESAATLSAVFATEASTTAANSPCDSPAHVKQGSSPGCCEAVPVAAKLESRVAQVVTSEAKSRALRAVVQDDVVSLRDVLSTVQQAEWSTWQNKAGKDLITLAQERGSTGAYAELAKQLGLLQEMQMEDFHESEAVWVFLPGDVQPRRATVLQSTVPAAEDVHIEYWDGEEPPTTVQRCLIRKMSSP
mmetsp:Transcript_35639/g.65310  ORF Transcript_35639/g.65310 Transcript_35639/m.65310 type:complete len:728 (+) Transcript_35639:58-2241(+)